MINIIKNVIKLVKLVTKKETIRIIIVYHVKVEPHLELQEV